MKERIRKFMDYKSITPVELADQIGVQRSNVSHILNGRNKPGSAFLEKFLLAFPEISARWLLTGEGEMIGRKEEMNIPAAELPESDRSQMETGSFPAESASKQRKSGYGQLEFDHVQREPHPEHLKRGHGEMNQNREQKSHRPGEIKTGDDPNEPVYRQKGAIPGPNSVRSEPEVPYGNKASHDSPESKGPVKHLDKVILLYTDGTFVSYHPE